MQPNIKLYFRGTSRPEVFPIGNSNPKALREITKHQSQGNRVYDTDGIGVTLASQAGGLGAKTGLYAISVLTSDRVKKPAQWRRTEKGKAFRREAQKNGRDLTPFNDGYRELVPKDSNIIGTITSQAIAKDSLLFDGMAIRRLTPTECMRLQGFPDDWCDYGADGEVISDSQKYKMAGNAVTTTVVTAIIRKLI